MPARTLIRPALALAVALALFGCGATPREESDAGAIGAEILWDDWGVPHVFAENPSGLFYALGWAQAYTDADRGFTASYEGALELYYRGRITPWFHLSPHVQYIVNPGSNDVSDAVTLGVRGQIAF